ncbi:MAG TPA: nucleotidyl transferase AbiEii/AbiGii toxin family protein, partial [Candidatus Limnocylindrales bacterium]|nr:nucleotidyl transferase AbiEii/AbiGii toxin family protein [Candidatus Limnocylindrales bacterium]
MIVLGDRNSRIKDFFDLHHLASRFEFDRVTLAEAVRQTFERRRTPVPSEEPIGLTPAYWENVSRGPQIRAFARRAGLTVGPAAGTDILAAIGPFLLPILDDLRTGIATRGTWPPGGPWRSEEQVTYGRSTRADGA